MRMDARAWIFLFIILCGLVVTLVVLYLRHRNQEMLHQERLTALEKGAAVPVASPRAPWSPRVYLLRGLIWSFSGAALLICLLGLAMSSHRPQSAESMMWSARNLSRILEIPLDQATQIVEKDRTTREQGMPATIALLGLIPLGVGLAYLVFYYTDESRKNRGADARPI
jgi:Flp pilus assembly protein protease CpaA